MKGYVSIARYEIQNPMVFESDRLEDFRRVSSLMRKYRMGRGGPRPGFGGKQPGAGRKAKPVTGPVQVNVILPADLCREIDARRGELSRGEYIRRTLTLPGIIREVVEQMEQGNYPEAQGMLRGVA